MTDVCHRLQKVFENGVILLSSLSVSPSDCKVLPLAVKWHPLKRKGLGQYESSVRILGKH